MLCTKQISCGDCDVSYVGQTKRQFNTRINKHRKNINRPWVGISVVSKHRLNGHEFELDSIHILDRESSYWEKDDLWNVTYNPILKNISQN